jgi:N6-adenosine-specific RNA methylase IME4
MLYDVAMIDPPWPKKKAAPKKARPQKGRELDYRTLSLGEIERLLALDIWPCLATPASVFLWTIDEFLVPAEAMMERAGFRRHARLIWDKQNGVPAAFSVRYCHEYLLWYYRPKFMPVANDQRGRVSTVMREASREHSRKPDLAYQIIEKWFPAARRWDVFSRQPRDGWDQYGDQKEYWAKCSK